MPKIQWEPKPTIQIPVQPHQEPERHKEVLDHIELSQIAKEIEEAGGEQKWYVKRGAIWFDSQNRMFVKAIDSPDGKSTSTLYDALKEKVAQLHARGVSKN